MGFSVTQLLIILAIVLLLFGAKRLRGLGGDVGEAIKGFRKAMHDGEREPSGEKLESKDEEGRVIDAEATREASPEAEKHKS